MSLDRVKGDTFTFRFTTRAFATGMPTVLAGSPVLSAMEDAVDTPFTTGVSFTASSVAGLNLCTIDSSQADFEAGKEYDVYLSAGTVDSVSVIGEVVGHFSLSREAAAVDLANGTDGLSALKTIVDAIQTVTNKFAFTVANQVDCNLLRWIGVAPAALVTQKVQTDVAAISGDINAANVLGDWLNRGKISTADAGGSTTTLVDTALGAGVDDKWNGMLLLFTSGSNLNYTAITTDYDSASATLTFTPAVPFAVTGGTYVLVPGLSWSDLQAALGDVQSVTDLKDFADAGYDPGSNKITGCTLTDTVTTVTNQLSAATIGNQVWDTDATGRQSAGTFGQAIGDPGANAETMYDAVVTDAAGTNIAADIIVIEGQTDDIGVAGAGLTDLGGMSDGMKAEVESEANDALVAQKLDHLVAVAENDDPVDDSIFAKIADAGTGTSDWSAFIPAEDSLRAISEQVRNVGSGAAGAVNIEAIEDNSGGAIIDGVVKVGTITGDFNNLDAEDGSIVSILHDNDVIDYVVGYQVGGSRTATFASVTVNVNGNNDEIAVKAFDHVSTWDVIGIVDGSGGSTYQNENFPLLVKHTGTGAELGKVYIRYATDTTTPALLEIDKGLVLATNIGQSSGYANGQIWVDTVSGVAGTEAYVNGTADNPVRTWADALTLSAAVGLTDFHIINGSTIQLSANSDNHSLFGDNWILDLNTQSVDGAHFAGAIVSGTFTGTPEFSHCEINALTGPSAHLDDCALNNTITANAVGDWVFHDSKSNIAGPTTPIFDFGTDVGVSSNVIFADHQNGIEFRNYNNSGTDLLSLSGVGQVIYAASSSGSVQQRGDWKVTNTGGVTIVEDDNTANLAAVLVDTIEIGTAGAGLTDLGGMSDGMKAEVESEANDALVAQKLDHLVAAADGDDPVNGSIMSHIVSVTEDWSTFVPSTDSLQALRDRGDAAWITATGFSTHNAAAVWSVATRALTDKVGFSLSTAGILAIWHQAVSAIVTAGTIGKLLIDEITSARMATLTDWINGGRLDTILDARMAEASISTTGGAVDTVTSVTNDVGITAAAVDDIWDEVLSMAAHNGAQSAGKRLRQISTSITIDGTVNDASASTTAFDTDLTGADDFWNDALIIFTSGALAGQSRPILTYVNASGRITVDEALTSAPANGVEFVIESTHIHPIAQITAGVLAGSLSSETTAGTLSKAISDIETDTAEIGTAGAGLSNIDLPDQTMDITGSLSGSVGSVTGAVGSVAGNVDGNVTGSVGSLAAQAKADVQAEVDTSLASYDGPTNAEMEARTLDAGPLAQLSQNLDNCLTGTASGTPTTTTMVSDIGVTVDDQFNGRIITFDDDTTTAALREQSTDITGCTASSNTLTFTALTTAPVSGDTFVIT